MKKLLNLVIVITLTWLISGALFAAPQKDACEAPCGKPTAWDEFNKFELKMTVPKEPGYSSWKGTFDKQSLDIQINVEVLDGKKVTKGKILMVGGRVLAVTRSASDEYPKYRWRPVPIGGFPDWYVVEGSEKRKKK